MEGTRSDWTRKVVGSQLDVFTMYTGVRDVEEDTLALYSTLYDLELYNTSDLIENIIMQMQPSYQRESIAGEKVKRGSDSEAYSDTKRSRCSETTTVSNLINANSIKTEIMEENQYEKHITATESSYNKKVLTYKIITEYDSFMVKTQMFLKFINDTVLYLMKKTIQNHNMFHVEFVFQVESIQQAKRVSKSFETAKSMFVKGDNLDNFVLHVGNIIKNQIAVIETNLNCFRITCIEMRVVTALQKLTTNSWQVVIENGENSIDE